jgi:hypothetical protein
LQGQWRVQATVRFSQKPFLISPFRQERKQIKRATAKLSQTLRLDLRHKILVLPAIRLHHHANITTSDVVARLEKPSLYAWRTSSINSGAGNSATAQASAFQT